MHLPWGSDGGSRSIWEKKTDWASVASNSHTEDRTNYIAGDLNMLRSDFPDVYNPDLVPDLSPGDAERLRMKKEDLEQVLGYARVLQTCYAYLLTPFELIVARTCHEEIQPPEASLVNNKYQTKRKPVIITGVTLHDGQHDTQYEVAPQAVPSHTTAFHARLSWILRLTSHAANRYQPSARRRPKVLVHFEPVRPMLTHFSNGL